MTVMARFLNEANNGVICKLNTFVLVQMVCDSLTQHRPLPVIIAFFSETRTAPCQIQARNELNRDPWGHFDSKSIAQVS